jgi:hypothetical protein
VKGTRATAMVPETRGAATNAIPMASFLSR